MRAFPVRLPSGARYWTVLDEDLAVVAVADGFLRQVRFGRDGAESTTKSYAHSIALFLRWCARTGRTWQAGVEQLAVVHDVAGPCRPGRFGCRRVVGGGAGRAGRCPGARCPADQRGADRGAGDGGARGARPGRRTGIWCRCCMRWPTTGTCREAARGEDGADVVADAGPASVARAGDGRWIGPATSEIVALLRACRSARDRLIVLLMARAGLRRGEVCGLRRSDVHLLDDSRPLGCEVTRAHLHVVRRDDNPERGVGEVPAAAGGAAGFPDGAGLRHLRVRADDACRGPRPAISWW